MILGYPNETILLGNNQMIQLALDNGLVLGQNSLAGFPSIGPKFKSMAGLRGSVQLCATRVFDISVRILFNLVFLFPLFKRN